MTYLSQSLFVVLLSYSWTLFAQSSISYLDKHCQCINQKLLFDNNLSFDSLHTNLEDSLNIWKVLKICKTLPQLKCILKSLPKTDSEKAIYRFNGSTIAYYDRKCNASVSKNLKLLHHLSNYVEDSFYLDKNSWYIEYQIAASYAKLNDYDQAIFNYLKVVPGLIKRKQYSNLSRLYGDLSNAYFWNGDFKQAEKTFFKGLALSTKAKDRASLHLKYAHQLIKNNLENHNIKKHIQLCEQEINLIDKNDDSMLNERRKGLNLLKADFHEYKNQDDSSLYYNKLALKQGEELKFGNSSRTQSKISLKIANLYFNQSNLSDALSYILTGLSHLNPNIQSIPYRSSLSYLDNTFVDLNSLAAEIFYQKYNQSGDTNYLNKSKQCISSAINLHNDLELGLDHRKSIIASKKTTSALLKRAIQIEYSIMEIGGSNSSQIREMLNKSKSNYLLDVQARLESIESLDQKNKELLSVLRDSLFSISILTAEKGTTEELEKRKFLIQSQIQEILPIPETQINPNIEVPYVEYFRGSKFYYIFTNITNKRFYRIGNTHLIDSLINKLSKVITSQKNETKLVIYAHDLYNHLTPDTFIFPETCAIIRDFPLTKIPFDILVNKGKYLILNHEFYYPPHIQFLSFTNSNNSLDRILCVSPNYPKDIDKTKLLGNNDIFIHLPYTEKEVKIIKNSFKSNRVSIVNNISKTDLVSLLNKHDHLHFSGHAMYNSDTAALLLTDPKGHLYKLTHHEILSMKAKIPSVYLSACETGIGKLMEGEGIASVSRSFMEGTQTENVIYTLWPVFDQSTAEIISKIYSKKTFINSLSLADAKRSYIKKASPDKRHPYFWAGIQQTCYSTNPTKKNKLWNVLILTLVILFTLIVLKRPY